MSVCISCCENPCVCYLGSYVDSYRKEDAEEGKVSCSCGKECPIHKTDPLRCSVFCLWCGRKSPFQELPVPWCETCVTNTAFTQYQTALFEKLIITNRDFKDTVKRKLNLAIKLLNSALDSIKP